MFMHFSCIHTIFFYLTNIKCVGTFLFVPLSLFLSISCSMAPKQKSTLSWNPLHSKAFSSSPSTDTTPSHVWFHDDKACKDFSENFSQRGIHLERQVVLSDFFNTNLPTVIYSRGWESLCGIPITCLYMIIQEFYFNIHGFDYYVPHFITHIRGTCIVVTPDLISKVLHIPRVKFANYLSYECLRIVSKEKLSSRFHEKPSSWDDHQNTPCSGFTKGSRFLNMVMTFILHPLSHYNSITEPYAWFLLSLLKGLTINFPSHFILSFIDVYRDTTTRDKLIFPLAITRILRHFFCLLSWVYTLFYYVCHRWCYR